MPLLVLLGGSLLAERLLVDWLHAWLAVGHDGEVRRQHECRASVPVGFTRKACDPAVRKTLLMCQAPHLLWAFS